MLHNHLFLISHSNFNPSCQAFLSIIPMKLKTRIPTVYQASQEHLQLLTPSLKTFSSFGFHELSSPFPFLDPLTLLCLSMMPRTECSQSWAPSSTHMSFQRASGVQLHGSLCWCFANLSCPLATYPITSPFQHANTHLTSSLIHLKHISSLNWTLKFSQTTFFA